MPNQLAHETSPYLLQHANNPVNWYPWGEEALRKAQEEDKPIFLSIGYAACHWCHVMEHESFENPQIARLLNDHFVSIKVDREERPDLDSIYMSAVIAMVGQGGWPMSVFLTPKLEPFYGGTYFPPAARYGMPAFGDVLTGVIQTWKSNRAEISRMSQQLGQFLKENAQWNTPSGPLLPGTLQQATETLIQTYDWEHGGWGAAPKFPAPMAIEFLLQQGTQGNSQALQVALHALKTMNRGGIYDVVGGGFHRYSTDAHWLVPHFEKMLYDNAQLARTYLHAYLLTGEVPLRQTCEETLDFILKEMTHPEGGFYSSLDADSEGEEGKFYLWTPEEIRQALPEAEDQDRILSFYNVTEAGNFEGKTIFQQTGETPAEMYLPLQKAKKQLDRFRARRQPPATDDKVLVFWNALMLQTLAEAARYLHRSDYLQAAQKNARFLLQALHPQDRLLRSWRDGQAKHNACLEDYGALILGLLTLYQTDLDSTWYQHAILLAKEMLAAFQDASGELYDTRRDQADLL
ncbi:MAG: thioredoxin domain-containing protein, partial [Chloroflexi bacterium]|nr:thioredoxin domain-containing protein [Chloroflexota bacterium]